MCYLNSDVFVFLSGFKECCLISKLMPLTLPCHSSVCRKICVKINKSLKKMLTHAFLLKAKATFVSVIFRKENRLKIR